MTLAKNETFVNRTERPANTPHPRHSAKLAARNTDLIAELSPPSAQTVGANSVQHVSTSNTHLTPD